MTALASPGLSFAGAYAMKEHTAVPDPLHLAAALNFLASSPAPRITLSPVTGQRRRFMLEDTGAALTFLAAPELIARSGTDRRQAQPAHPCVCSLSVRCQKADRPKCLL